MGVPTPIFSTGAGIVAAVRVAFLGLGIMGSRMAAHLAADTEFELTVWNRTRATAEQFCAAHNARIAETPAAAAASAELVITMVVDGPQVEQVLLGEPDGAAYGAAPGTLFVDCSTIGPTATLAIAERLREAGHSMVDAPVTGSSPRAQDGTLTIMAGGSPEDFERALPAFHAMGKVIVRTGPVGHGQRVKVISNAVAATNATALGQALLVAAKAGVDLDAMVAVMRTSAGGSTMLDLKSEWMRRHDYTSLYVDERSTDGRETRVPRAFFKTDHMLKDVRLCLEEAKAEGVPFPLAEAAEKALADASALGHGEEDFSALIEPLERSADVRLD
jgi:3-hydroxyisobutyrate dehydrogenase-like beta-hydroxyacid dehydrogenase